MSREYAPGEYKGTAVNLADLRRKEGREKLVGKRIGYDRKGSCLMNFGLVTAVLGTSLEVNGNVIDRNQFTQIVILDDQGSTPPERSEVSA